MLTTNEIEQYVRLTLRQYKMEHVKVSFKKMEKTLGYFWAEKNEIVLSLNALDSFVRFKNVLLHELVHAFQYAEQGTFKTKNGRNDFHGKSFKKWCKVLGISSSRFIA
jgi:predicted SprT family Zn-dependent metalloprotease